MNLNRLTYIAFEVNDCIDAGHGDSLEMDVIQRYAKAGELLDFLDARLDGHIDLSLLTDEERSHLNESFADMAMSIKPSDLLVRHRGLCLVMGWVLEMIQRAAKDIK